MEAREHSRSMKSTRSMSDADSQFDSFHSPLRSESPLRSDDPDPPPANSPNSKAIVPVEKFYSPFRSPPNPNNYQNPKQKQKQKQKRDAGNVPPAKEPSPMVVFNRSVKDEVPSGVTRVGPGGGVDVFGNANGGDGGGGGLESGVGGERRSRAAVASILRRSKKEVMVKRAELGFRVCEIILCVISFSIMISDKTQGWSGDSYDRYKEYRYCVAVTIIGFVYSALQACVLVYDLSTGRRFLFCNLSYQFDFAMDQILAYLLISASSSAATRVDDWVSNWGKDEFTKLATASIIMSFLAFAAFAISSLISAYNLWNRGTS